MAQRAESVRRRDQPVTHSIGITQHSAPKLVTPQVCYQRPFLAILIQNKFVKDLAGANGQTAHVADCVIVPAAGVHLGQSATRQIAILNLSGNLSD